MSKAVKNFGEFLTQKRTERGVSLRELAKQIGVSAPFLTEVEKSRCAPLTPDRMAKVAQVLDFSKEEKCEMYDIVGIQKDTVPPDLPEYIKGKDYVSVALRTARDLGASEAEWMKFVEDLKKRKAEQ